MAWLAEEPDKRVRTVEGTLAFVDVSGFTALTERLAVRGKAGAEEVSDVVGATFAQLLDIAYEYGGEMLKWGGDAALLLFEEPGSAARASRATWLISRAMPRLGNVTTSVGRVRLGVSIGVHRGRFDLYLVGEGHRELVITGPPATETTQMEGAAESGEVLVSAATAAELDPRVLGDEREGGRLLCAAPRAEPRRPPRADLTLTDPSGLLSTAVRERLLGGGEPAEHRNASISFIQFRGVDALHAEAGGDAVAEALEPIVSRAEAAADRHGVAFHYADIAGDGGKILLTGGLPVVRGDDEDRLLRATLEVVHAAPGPLRVRAGLNAGRFFVHDAGGVYRRIYSFSGDAINLAARVMGRADDGQVVATDSFLTRVHGFVTESLEPFNVKGKTEPVLASVVLGRRDAKGAQKLPSAPSTDSALPLIGRDAELKALAEAAARAMGGAGAAVEIVAEPGMGKSRLVAEAAASWDLETRRMFCEEYGEATPYLPFRHLFDAVLGVAEAAGSDEAAQVLADRVASRAPGLVAWVPLLATLVGAELPLTPEIEQIEPRFRRSRLAVVTVELLDLLCERPLGLVFEDVHAIDEASADLLNYLVDAAVSRPWLLVLTRRASGVSPLGEEVDPPHYRLELGPLDAQAAAGLLEVGGGDDLGLSDHDRKALLARSGGNPLFLLELTSAVASDQPLDSLPDDLELLLAAQIDRLAPGDRQVLRAAAVLGVWFDVTLLSQLMAEDGVPEDIWERLRSLVVPEGAEQGRFAHALVRDAAYEGLSFRRRRELHHRAALAIEARAPDPEAEAPLLSLHYLHADRFAETWHYARSAGRRAGAIYANVDAATFYQRALVAAQHLPARERPAVVEVAEVAEALGDVEEMAGMYTESASAYGLARRLTPPGTGRMRLLRKTGVVHERSGEYRAALRCYSLARRLAGGGDLSAAIEACEAAIAYSGVRYRQGRHRDCVRWAELATAEAANCEHLPGLAHALYVADLARTTLGVPSDGSAQRALDIYEEIGDLYGQENVLNNMGIDAYDRGRWPQALDFYTRSAALCERVGDVIGAATEQHNIAEILSDQGLFEEAAELFTAARRTWLGAHYPIGLAQVALSLGLLAGRRGERDQAVELLGEALARCRSLGSKVYEFEVEVRLLEADVLAGEVTGAAARARDLLHRSKSVGSGADLITIVLRLLGVCEASDDPQAAMEALDSAVAEARRLSAVYELALCLAARAVVRDGTGLRQGADHDAVTADAVEARRIMLDLGVVQTAVTSLGDVWPNGPLARRLAEG
jgi:class 3 adenylate cyclase/tetratricopeptide (TPR) repeat protein